MVIILMNLTVRVQGYTLLSNDNNYKEKDIVTFSSSESTSKKLVLSHNNITLASGQTIQIKAKIESEAKITADKTKFIWKSDNSASVQVNSQGQIKAIKPNSKAVITVSSADKKLITTCKVSVMSEQEASSCVAIIDNVKVTKQEYMVFSRNQIALFLGENSIVTQYDKFDWKHIKINGKVAKDLVKQATLQNILGLKIEVIKAKEAGIKLTANDLTEIEKRINFMGSKEDSDALFNALYGVTFEEYKEIYKEVYLADKYVNSERNKITVSDNEVKKYYDANKKAYDKVTVTHILIKTVDSNGVAFSKDKKSEAKKKAEDLLAKVKAGEDIKTLAQMYSEDPGVTENKGEYTFSKGEMVKEFEDWSFSHSVGDIGLVESVYGYHVMKLEKRVETPFDYIKSSIKYNLTESKFNTEFKKKMDSWKNEARFEILINKKTIEKVDKSLYGA